MVFAVVFLIVVATLVSATLAYSASASRSVTVYERDRALHYAADSALDVAVQMGKDQAATIGIAGSATPCNMTFPLGGPAYEVHDPGQVFSDTARLVVECRAATATSGQLDAANFQQTRDVIFTVSCSLPLNDTISENDLNCARDEPEKFVLGEARVRYDIDPGWPTPATQARVPKVVDWDLRR